MECAVLTRCVSEFYVNRWSYSCINILLRNSVIIKSQTFRPEEVLVTLIRGGSEVEGTFIRTMKGKLKLSIIVKAIFAI